NPGADATIDCPNAPVFTPPTATDTCDPSPQVVEVSDVTVPGACAGTYTRTKTWKAVDACGNQSATKSQAITVRDITAPVITECPLANINVHAAPGGCNSGPVNYSATATDACDGAVTPVFSIPSGSTFPPGTTTVMVTATDACGNSSSCSFDVINDGQYELAASVELGGGVMADGSFTRCITFELWNGGVSPAYTLNQILTFSGDYPTAKTGSATLLVPC